MGLSRKSRARIRNAGVYLGLLAFSLALIFPLLWMISTSFKPMDEIFTKVPRWIPKNPTLSNYAFLLFNTDYPVFFKNSIKISLTTTVAALIVAVFAGYSLSRFNFKGRAYLGVLIIAVQMFPYVLLVIPLFTVMRAVGLIDTHISLIIAYGTFALPFSAWMLKGYFDTIPVSLEEAAIIDGCSRLQVLYRIVLPLAAPGLVAVAMFAFILAWQEYIYALAFTRSSHMRTLTIGLAMMQGQHGRISWGQIMAGSFLACIPPILVFTLLQRFIVQGFTRGAVKE